MLEVPHEGSGIKKADGGDTETGMRDRTHALLEYQFALRILRSMLGGTGVA